MRFMVGPLSQMGSVDSAQRLPKSSTGQLPWRHWRQTSLREPWQHASGAEVQLKPQKPFVEIVGLAVPQIVEELDETRLQRVFSSQTWQEGLDRWPDRFDQDTGPARLADGGAVLNWVASMGRSGTTP